MEYFNIGRHYFEYLMRFHKSKIYFIKVVILIKLIYFRGNHCLKLKLTDYKKFVAKFFLETLYNFFCISNLGYVTSQSIQYGGIHDSHFKYIQNTITSLFLGRFWKLLH